jgi:hypothetical protein
MRRLFACTALLATLCVAALFATQVTGFWAPAFRSQTPTVDWRSSDGVKAFALQWFTHLQEGQLDRTQMTTALSENLSEGAVEEMSHYLKSYGPADRGEIIENRKIDDQTFYFLKLFLQRGDALTLLVGFDENGKMTGVTFPSMGHE